MKRFKLGSLLLGINQRLSCLRAPGTAAPWLGGLLLLCLWIVPLGGGMAAVLAQSRAIASGVPERYQLGQEFYLKNCASCHTPIPPEVLPTETWKELLENPQKHFTTSLKPFFGPELVATWTYVRDFSRSLLPNEPSPVNVAQSRYFKALHPKVNFPEPPSHRTCLSCHPGARELDYRKLSS
ncbi:MAG: cytochrome C [Chloroflexaceae bacterium]|nr:cytochrome C [Chloroflexaceae bacterium]